MEYTSIRQKIPTFLIKYKGLLVVLTLAIIARGVFFLFVYSKFGPIGFVNPINEDAGEYVSIAKNLAEHGVFSRDIAPEFAPERLRTPGYPLILSIFYKIVPSTAFLALAQNIIFLLAIFLLYQICLLAGASKRVALAASALLAIEPATLYWNNQLVTESLFTVFLLVSTYFLLSFLKSLKWNLVFFSGFFLGYALLIRPITQYLIIIFFLWLILAAFVQKIAFKKIILGTMLLLTGYFSILAPWMYRNQVLFGTGAVSTMNVGFGKYVRAIHGELGITVDYTRFGGVERTEVERLKIVSRDAILTILQHPLIFARIHVAGLFPFFLGDGYLTSFGTIFPSLLENRIITDWTGAQSQLFGFISGHRGAEAVVFWGGKIIWSALFVLACLGFFKLYKKRGFSRLSAIFFLLIVYYFALASGVGSYSRFRFPVNSFWFYFVASGIYFLISKFFPNNAGAFNSKSSKYN